jgi:hypothetical protein
MRLHPGRILGLVMGLLILVTIFVIPFTSQTLYATLSTILTNLGSLQSGGMAVVAMNYVLITVFLLLVIAGFVGIFPLGTGVLGVVAMALYTVGPILIYPSLPAPVYGTGYYVVWVASIVSLAASFWHHSGQKKVTTSPPPATGTTVSSQ